jgi:hypothetical protein
MNDVDVFAIDSRPTQFDYWQMPQKAAGQDVLILKDEVAPNGLLESRFDAVELLDELSITRFGVEIYRYQLYVGRNFKP